MVYLSGRNFNAKKYILNNSDTSKNHHLNAKANSNGSMKKARFWGRNIVDHSL